MMKKKIIIISILVVLTFIFAGSIYYLKKGKLIEEVMKFNPFNNSLLLNEKQSIIINTSLPKIEAASAFYYIGANIVQNIYNESVYEDQLSMVSTNEAFNDLINGKTDFIIATGPSDEQKEMINKSSLELEYIVIYKEPLAFYINKNNRVDNLSISNIKKIYESNFEDYNSYQLKKNNGSQTCFESLVKNNQIDLRHKEIKTMPKIIDEVGKDKKGIGYAFYTYINKMHNNKNIKIISIDGKTVENENYPLLFDVYLIYNKDNKNENIEKIVDWIESEEGRRFINKLGYRR